MDDENRGDARFQRVILELRHLSKEQREQYIKECEIESKNFRNDGWSIEFYKEILEAAKNV